MNEDFITPRRVALGLALLLVLTFLGPASGTTTFFYRDFGVLAYPTIAYHHEMFWRGEVPFWNPYSNLGVPFLAQWGTMTLYPFSLFYLLLPLPWSINFFCLGHLWWGAVGVFYLARRWTGSNAGSSLAAILFLFNGLTQSALTWPNYTVAFAWMPWIVFSAERLWQKRPHAIPLAALTGAMQMFSGVPEVILLTWILALSLWIMARCKEPAAMAKAIVLIAGLSAIQLLPFFELLSHSHRQSGASAAKWALPLTALGNFALPMLHNFHSPQGTYHQLNQTFLSSTYLGLPALLFAIIGAIRGDNRARLLFIASIACVLLALGPNLPGFALVQKIPVIGLIRYPVKFTLLLALTVPLLAAYGFRSMGRSSFYLFAGLLAWSIGMIIWTKTHPLPYDRWPETFANSVIRLTLFAASFGLLQLWLRRSRPEYLLLLLILLAIDGRFHHPNQNPTNEAATFQSAPNRSLPKLGEGRIFISLEAEEKFLRSGITNRASDLIGKRLGEWSHLNLLDLVPKVNGSATLVPREQKEFIDWLYHTNTEPRDRERWLNFVGATHITSPQSPIEWTNRTGALPLVRADHGATAETLKFSQHEIIAMVKAPDYSALTIAQTKYPGWRAEKENGEPLNAAELVTEKGRFQLFALPAGNYQVRVFYRDNQFIIGAAISLLSLAACCALFWLAKLRS